MFAQELPAVDAVYHQAGNVNFRTSRNTSSKFSSIVYKNKSSGAERKVDTHAAFQRLIEEFLENDDEQTRVGELVDCMKELCHDPYSLPYMKEKILEYFESLYITQIDNRQNIVTIKRHAGEILNKFHVDSQEEGGEETKEQDCECSLD